MRGLEELVFQVHSEERISEIMLQIKKKKTNRRSHQSLWSETQVKKKKACAQLSTSSFLLGTTSSPTLRNLLDRGSKNASANLTV